MWTAGVSSRCGRIVGNRFGISRPRLSDTVQRAILRRTRYTCYGCHAHSRSGIREEHLEEGIYRYENCVECHRSGEAEEGDDGGREGRS